MLLSAEEVRVLGCLVEKQLATPQQYPLTENAVIAACNQSTNRHPIVSYDSGDVRRALVSLRQQGLARTSQRPGERAHKHRHLLPEALELSVAEVALLSVLMLRGAQTVGELRARSERLHTFGSLDEVEATLDALAQRAEPLVARLPRQPSHKEARVAQLLQGELSIDDLIAAPIEEAVPAPPRVGLAVQFEAIRAEVAELRHAVDELKRRLDDGRVD